MSWLAPTPHPAARKSLFTPGVNALKLSGPLWHESSGSPMSARVSAKPGELVAPNPECPRRPSQIEKEAETSTSFRRRSVVQTASERLSGAGVAWAPSDRKSSAAVSPTAAKISFQSRRSLSQNHVIRSTKLQRVVTSRVVDDFTQRSRRLRRVHLMSEHKRRIAGALIAVTLLGVIYAVALVEVRLGGLAPVATIDQLRAANLGILALELALLFEYYRASRAIHLFCSHDPADLLSWIVFDVALLAVGVVPPGVEVDLANPCASELHYECSAEDETLHIDCAYGALAVLRLLAIARWALAFSLLSDPVLLSWQYRVEVRSTFRLKYLFQKRPVLVLSAFIATCWSCCSFWLHVFEYHASGLNVEQGLAEFLFVGWDVVSGLGWGAVMPRTHLGHVASIILSASGIVSVALLTATFVSNSELDASELGLISNLEKRRLIRKQKVLAVKLVQARFRHWRAVRKRQRTKEAVSPQPHDVQRKPSMRRRTGSVVAMTDAMIGESKTKPARTRAARRFKNLRAQIDHFTTTEERVANMKVIHADLTVLKTALSQRVAKIEADQRDMGKLVKELHKKLVAS